MLFRSFFNNAGAYFPPKIFFRMNAKPPPPFVLMILLCDRDSLSSSPPRYPKRTIFKVIFNAITN